MSAVAGEVRGGTALSKLIYAGGGEISTGERTKQQDGDVSQEEEALKGDGWKRKKRTSNR